MDGLTYSVESPRISMAGAQIAAFAERRTHHCAPDRSSVSRAVRCGRLHYPRRPLPSTSRPPSHVQSSNTREPHLCYMLSHIDPEKSLLESDLAGRCLHFCAGWIEASDINPKGRRSRPILFAVVTVADLIDLLEASLSKAQCLTR